MLDTNICIYIINKKSETILKKLENEIKSGIGISSITLSELEYGVYKSKQVERNSLNLLKFLAPFEIIAFDETAAREYGIIRSDLERKGQPIGGMDLLIGSHAKSLGITLITNNLKEFQRIDDLKVENWISSK